VAYRESPGRASRGSGRFNRTSPTGKNQYAEVEVEIAPHAEMTVKFVNNASPDQVPPAFVPFVEEGVAAASWSGPIVGFPVTRAVVKLVGGSFRDDESSEIAFAAAARSAFEEAIASSDPQVLEPIMKFEIHTPDTYQGGVIGDLNSRRAEIHDLEREGDGGVIRGMVPLAEMFGYTSDLRSLTQGRGSCSLEPAAYAPVPPAVRKNLMT
jgi:elongation factor G